MLQLEIQRSDNAFKSERDIFNSNQQSSSWIEIKNVWLSVSVRVRPKLSQTKCSSGSRHVILAGNLCVVVVVSLSAAMMI